MASNELTAKVRIDANQAVKTLDKLIDKINKINDAVTKSGGVAFVQVANATQRASRALGEGDKAAKRLATTARKLKQTEYERWWQEALITRETQRQITATTTYNKWVQKSNTLAERVSYSIRKWKFGVDQSNGSTSIFNKNLSTTDNIATRVLKTMRRVAATYFGIMGAQSFMSTSDTITGAKNQLNNLPGGNAELTAEAMDKIYAAAQRSRGSYTDMLSNVGQVMTLAPDAFQGKIDNATRFMEIMNKSYAISGTKDEAKLSSMYQLIQGLSSGVLQGDELKSVREGATKAYQAIEAYAQRVLQTKDSLKDLASEGLITSDIVVAAIMEAETTIDEAFNKTKRTFGDVTDEIKNMATEAFTPVFEQVEAALNSSTGRAFVQGLGNELVNLAEAVGVVLDAFGKFFTWCANNWSWLQYVVVAVINAIIIAIGYYTAKLIASAIKTAIYWAAAHWQLVLIIGVIAILVAAIIWVANTAEDGCEFISKALLYIAFALAVVGAILNAWWLVWVAIALAIVALIISCLDYIMGALAVAGAVVYNLLVAVVDSMISCLWTMFVEPVAGMIEWFVNAWNGGFTSAAGGFANFCGQLLSGLVALFKPLATMLDKIFGWDVNSAIESAQAAMRSWGKNENATTFNLNAPTVSSLTGGKLPERIAYGDAWDAGFALGSSWQDKIGNLASPVQDAFSKLSLDGNLGTNGNFNGSGLPDPYSSDYALGSSYDPSAAEDDIANGLTKLGNIDDNTDTVADNMDLSNDDLEYLRKIAETEWKKEYTTAEITVDMTNNNTINDISDLDGIFTKLSEELIEELNIGANGVYGG